MTERGKGNDALALAVAGFLATAVTYGPARMGFGLFLPQFRAAFGLSTEQAGLIASSAFFGFLAALPVAAALTARIGPRLPVVIGGALATVGLALVAASPNAGFLTAGVVIAASSAGFSWTPYNQAVSSLVYDQDRPTVLSAISTGTTVGIAGAGLLAMLIAFSGLGWRFAWGAFALVGLVMTRVNMRVLGRAPGPTRAGTTGAPLTSPLEGLRLLLRRSSLPLFSAALSFGATSAIYLSFAADTVTAAGGLAGIPLGVSAPVIFMALGAAGFVGLAAGRLEALLGLAALLRAIFAASAISLALIGLMPSSWPAVLISAGLQGVCVMTVSAVFAFWSLRLFPALPSAGFTATILAVAAGSVAGPGLAGYVSGHFGAGFMFLCAGGLSFLTAAAMRSRWIRTRA